MSEEIIIDTEEKLLEYFGIPMSNEYEEKLLKYFYSVEYLLEKKKWKELCKSFQPDVKVTEHDT